MGDAYQALSFGCETDFIHCSDRVAAQELCIEHLSDDAGISMREHFSEETREAVVEDSLIAPRLTQGTAQRRQSSQDSEALHESSSIRPCIHLLAVAMP